MKTLCLLYTWTGSKPMYDKRAGALQPGDIAVVVSGQSGPQPYDPVLHENIKALWARSIQVLGYVHCSISPSSRITRPLMDIFKDITDWRVRYGITRPFLDEWPTGRHEETKLMWGAVRGLSGSGTPAHPILMVINPGVPEPGVWVKPPPGTLIVTHENNYVPAPIFGVPVAPWEVAIVHSTPDPAAARTALEFRGWQWGYTTSDGPDGDPFDEDEAN